MTQKKPMGRPKANTIGIMLRLPIVDVEQIDDLRRAEPDVPTRPEMIRRIITKYFDSLTDE